VSDELDSADAVAGEAPDPSTPQRPTGKRSRRRALETIGDEGAEAALEVAEGGSGAVAVKVKPAKKATRKTGPSRNPFAFVFTYLQQVVAELRKVIWPNRKQMVSYTTVVLAFLAFMVTLIGLADLGLAKLVLLVFG